jgi:hypothetical protein
MSSDQDQDAEALVGEVEPATRRTTPFEGWSGDYFLAAKALEERAERIEQKGGQAGQERLLQARFEERAEEARVVERGGPRRDYDPPDA